MALKNYIIAPAFNYGIVPYMEIFIIMGSLRNKLYGEGPKRKIYFPKDTLRKLGITPSHLWSFIHLPFLSPVEVSELNLAAQEYEGKYGVASLKKTGRDQGKFFSRKRSIRGMTPEDPFRAHRFLMNCFSISIGAKNYTNLFEIGKYTQSSYLERHFPFEPDAGKILPGEKYFWTFMQGVMSSDLCHNQPMRAEVTRKNKMVLSLSKSVEEWGDYLLNNIDRMF